jgi:hypothetical protein
MTTNMTAAVSAGNITKLIGLVTGNLTRYRGYAKDAAIAIIRHTEAFGDCSAAKALCRAINPKDKAAMVEYFRQCSPIRVTLGKTEADDVARLCKADKSTYTPFNLDHAIATDWWTCGKDKVEAEPKVIAEFFDAVEKVCAPSEKVLEKYSAEQRQEIAQAGKDLKLLIERYRVLHLAAKATGGGVALPPMMARAA